MSPYKRTGTENASRGIDRRVLVIWDLEQGANHRGVLTQISEEDVDKHDYLRLVQQSYGIPRNFLANQQEIDFRMRVTLLGWLHEIVVEYYLSSETWFLSANYVDRFCSLRTVSRRNFQLVGTTCFFLAMKYEEVEPLSIDLLAALTADSYTTNQILSMETEILNAIDFQLSPPTINQFLSFFHTVVGYDDPLIYDLANYLSELSVLCYELCSFQASTIAAGCLYLSLKRFNRRWTQNIREYSGYSETSMEFVTAILVLVDFWSSTFEQVQQGNINSVSEKYRHIARLEPYRFEV
eukprot:TRINITY_DN255_c0_g2_i1.p1 TRINITY_DN255_c0_g2~~TRINITY_DN255_c0_g2_i1.p1  ORF type:complete len:336 (-),score=58.31 TRINITY_DN255_c0_g2_i1:90-974(-)